MLKKSHALADKLVLSKLRALLGGNINFMPCGGAKLDETIGRFFHAIGINVKTWLRHDWNHSNCFCAGMTAAFNPDLHWYGDAGRGSENWCAEWDSVRGPMVMRGYYKCQKSSENVRRAWFFENRRCGHFDENGKPVYYRPYQRADENLRWQALAPQVVEGAIGKTTSSNRLPLLLIRVNSFLHWLFRVTTLLKSVSLKNWISSTTTALNWLSTIRSLRCLRSGWMTCSKNWLSLNKWRSSSYYQKSIFDGWWRNWRQPVKLRRKSYQRQVSRSKIEEMYTEKSKDK